MPLVDAIPPDEGKLGTPLHKPRLVMGDRAYRDEKRRMELSCPAIATEIACRKMQRGHSYFRAFCRPERARPVRGMTKS